MTQTINTQNGDTAPSVDNSKAYLKEQYDYLVFNEKIRLREFSLSLVADRLECKPIDEVLRDAEELFQYLIQDLTPVSIQ